VTLLALLRHVDLGAPTRTRPTKGVRMSNPGTLVSIGLPVRNAGPRVAEVVRSVLAQDHDNLELLISDNASTDDTEEVCRELAKSDSRITYHRQPRNIGLLNNFGYAIGAARGVYFRWIGDDDRLEPGFVPRCLDVFEADPRLILVTTAISYTGPGGQAESAAYTGTALASDDPIDRFVELLRLLNSSHLLIDPLYGMMRRETVAVLPRRNMLREDEVFATKLALAGPWQHIPEVLAHRAWKHERPNIVGRRLGVPSWQWRFATTLQVREVLRWLRLMELTDDQRRRARAALGRMYLTRQSTVVRRRARRLVRMATSR
jgi:glycosyltransferase involved in cell wall biosynthesis